MPNSFPFRQVTKCSKRYSDTRTSLTFAYSALRWRITSRLEVSPVKIKKRAAEFSLELIPTRDILQSLGRRQNRKFLLVGFAAETDHLEANATKKLREKNCDIIVANDARIGMETDENELLILFRDGETKKISRAPKTFLARELVKIFSNSQQKRLTKKM